MLFKGFVGVERLNHNFGIHEKGPVMIEINIKKIDENWFTIPNYWHIIELVKGTVKVLHGTIMKCIAGANVSYDDWLYPSYSMPSIPNVPSNKEINFSKLSFESVSGSILISKGTVLLIKLSTTDFTSIKKDEALMFKKDTPISPKNPLFTISPLEDIKVGSGKFLIGFPLF